MFGFTTDIAELVGLDFFAKLSIKLPVSWFFFSFVHLSWNHTIIHNILAQFNPN